MLHISEIADYRVQDVRNELSEGDQVLVKVINIDPQGKVKLSRRAVLRERGDEASESESRSPSRDRGEQNQGDRGGHRNDRRRRPGTGRRDR